MAAARAILGPARWIGRSIHSVDGAVRAEADGAYLLLAGTVFQSRTHPGEAPQGVCFLAEVRRLVRIPVLLSGAHASRNYAQAGAFSSFPVQGPYAKKFPTLRDKCAAGGRGGDWAQQTLEEVYGMPLAQLSEEWAAWTANLPFAL